MADSFFCLDIGDTYIKVVDSKVNNNKIDVSLMGLVENNNQFYSSDSEKNIENVSSIIKKLLEANPTQKKNVHCIIPDAYTFSQVVEMPNLNERELISAIRYQADQFIPMPIDETNIDIEILQENAITKKILVLMVAVPKNIVDRIQSGIELAGLIPVSVENSLSATARFFLTFGKLITLQANNILLVNMEMNSTSLYSFDTNKGTLLKNHNFPIGYQLFSKEIQINTNFDQKKVIEILQTYNADQQSSISVEQIISPLLKEYINEIRKFIALLAEKNQSVIQKIVLLNDSLRITSLPQLIEKSLSIPCQHLNPLSVFTDNKIIENYKRSLSLFVSAVGGNSR